MLMPSIFKESLFDDWFDDFDGEFYDKKNSLYNHSRNIMKTDVRETEKSYELDIDLPGFKKEDISVSLDHGYLTISSQKKQENDEKNDDGQYIRRERCIGFASRSFYVGDHVTCDDIHAKYEDGILKLSLPKDDKVIENKTFIEIK